MLATIESGSGCKKIVSVELRIAFIANRELASLANVNSEDARTETTVTKVLAAGMVKDFFAVNLLRLQVARCSLVPNRCLKLGGKLSTLSLVRRPLHKDRYRSLRRDEPLRTRLGSAVFLSNSHTAQ
jgi:hypothetical protein